MFKQKVPAMLRSYVPLAVAVTLLAGLICLTGQQVLRQGADDPQVQLAQDATTALANGQTLPAAAEVDIAASLAPYLIIFDEQGRPVDGSARLHGKLPEVPQGVLEAARAKGENRVTWQPERGVRSATVIVPVGEAGGYVLAGRSLAAVEARERNLRNMVAVGWLLIMGAALLAVVLVNLL